MADRNDDQSQGASYEGYGTPGQDIIEHSNSEAVPSPSLTGEQRIQAPGARIDSLNETPGDANPALAETVGMEQGKVSTADLLRAREAAEEQNLRVAGGEMYADQPPGAEPSDWQQTDSGRPNWPNDREESPVEYMEPPRVRAPYGATGAGGGSGIDTEQLEGRADALADRAGTSANKNESRSGMPQIGATPDEDQYERREMGRPTEQSEMDRLAPGMLNLPPEDGDGK